MTYTLREATTDEIEQWDDLVIHNPNHGEIFQSSAFATLKQASKWRVRHMIYAAKNTKIAALFLERHIPLIGTIIYCPKGPCVASREQFVDVLDANRAYAKTNPGLFAFKLEPELPAGTLVPTDVHKVTTIQPHASVACEITFDGDAGHLFMSYKARARNLVRNAEKNGVTIRPVATNDKTIDTMFSLYTTTGARNQFFVRPFHYYQRFWKTFSTNNGQMFFAERKGQLLAAGYVIWLGTKGWYKDAGSPRGIPLYNASYLMQWYMQRWLLEKGITKYEMMGLPPPDRLNDKTHPWYNVGVFKTAFNPTVTAMLGTVDQVIDERRYRLWSRLVERVLNRIARHIWHDSLY